MNKKTILLGLCCLLTPSVYSIDRTISVTGIGTVKVVPDLAKLTFSISKNNEVMSQAKEKVDLVSSKAVLMLKANKIPAENISGENWTIQPIYEYNPTELKQIFRGFNVTRTFHVCIPSLENYPKVLDELTKLGVENISQIQLESSENEKLKVKSTQLAIKDAKSKASLICAELGVELGKPKNISSCNSPIQPPPVMMMRSAMAPEGGITEPGTIDISDSIQIEFEVVN